MSLNKNNLRKRGSIIALVTILLSSMIIGIPSLGLIDGGRTTTPETMSYEDIMKLMQQSSGNPETGLQPDGTSLMSPDVDLGNLLVDNANDYHQTYQPWKSRAAVRCIAITDDSEYMAVGGGYLYDNEVHIYRWNPDIDQYSKVWVSGDEIIKGDVIDVDFGDTDNNDFLEIVAASGDGHFYVFEQQHIFDPDTNTENMFAHVYTSPYIGQVWGVEVNDTDLDHQEDIIVVSWDYKIHIYEYDLHSGYPFNPEHWITYKEKWTSEDLGYHLSSLAIGDTNYNGLPDMVVGSREGGIFIYENNGTVLDIQGQPYPLTQDNSYKQIANITDQIWRPIYSMDIGDLDGQPGDEVVIAAFAFNGYVLRYNQIVDEYYLQKLIKDFEPWTLKDFYPADDWVDNCSDGQNVYLNIDSSVLGTSVPEPVVNFASYLDIYPYNSGAAQSTTDASTYFQPNGTHSAWAIYDFGNDEEGVGNGNDKADVQISFNGTATNKDDFIITISPDYEHWMEIPVEDIQNPYSWPFFDLTKLEINVDSILNENKWTYYRYMNITVKSGTSKDYWVEYIELQYVNQVVSTALSASVGSLVTGNSITDSEIHAILGTVDGRIVAFKYNATLDEFVLGWDSWVDDGFSLGENIWAIKHVNTQGSMPVIYGLTDLDTNYELKPVVQPSASIAGIIHDYTLANIDQDSPATGEYIFSDDTGSLYYFNNELDYDGGQTAIYFSDINLEYSDNISVSGVELKSTSIGPEMIIGTFDSSISNLYDDFYDDSTATLPADLHMWTRAGPGYDVYKSLTELETSGQLRQLLANAQSVPSVDAVDVDGDGDTDLVVCIDGLYLLWNVGDDITPTFTLDSTYFLDINSVQGKRSYFGPQFVEFDRDGDYDIVLSYSNRVGATYFDNYGTATDPKWEEKKELLNNFDEEATINVYNLTKPLFVTHFEHDEYQAFLDQESSGKDLSDKYMTCYMFNVMTSEMQIFFINYDIQTTFMVATNPEVSRLEINSFKSEVFMGTYKWRNFGFRAIESWSTALDLYNWTMTVDTADIDQDGNGEIIIGDYDSNLYIFEHMTNNTYKRAFRSPDFLQFVATDDTPYSWDQFGGFEGVFNQTFWNHVSYLVVSADTDGDGYLEVAALAGTVIYVFEATDIDDTYILMYRYDSLRNPEADYLNEQGLLTPSGLSWANDLDLDGYGEYIVAFESQVFVYEPVTGSFYELFGNVASDDSSTGHYNLPGNSKAYPDVLINGILVTDTNLNGLEEIIIYGEYDTIDYANPGYIVMIESNELGYEIIWQAPNELVAANIINTIELADQDYDGVIELLIGGEKGISIWEFNGTSSVTTFENIGVITGHMNYPEMPSYSLLDDSNHANDGDVKQRQHDITEIYLDSVSFHIFFAVWIEDNGTQYSLHYAGSLDGAAWGPHYQIETFEIGSHGPAMYCPTAFQTSTNRIYVAWVQKVGAVGGTGYWSIWSKYSDDDGVSWSTPLTLATEGSGLGEGNPIRSLSLMMNSSSYDANDLTISYLYRNSTYSVAKMNYWDDSTTTIHLLGAIEATEEFNLNGIDVAVYPNGYNYAMVMSANKPEEDRTDYDIWYLELNSSLLPVSDARKIVNAPSVEHTPSIAFLETGTHPALVTFDSAGLLDAMSLSYGIVSDNYIDWSEPDILAVYPSYITPANEVQPYLDINTWTGIQHHSPSIGFRAPKVTATYDGRFALLTKLDFSMIDQFEIPAPSYDYGEDLLSQVYTLNYTSFTALNSATDIAIGDSDRDGLKEILVADQYNAKLFEMYSSADSKHIYTSKWISPEHDNLVSDVSIYDTNGNNFDELIYSVQGEDVYVYEVLNLFQPIADIHLLELQYTSLASNTATNEITVEADLDGDSINDMVVSYDNGNIYGIAGNDGSLLWTITDSATQSPVFIADSIYQGTSAILIIYANGTAHWLSSNDGSITQTITLNVAGQILPLGTMFNATGDNTMDIAVRQDSNWIRVLNGLNGNSIGEYDDIGADAQDMAVATENGQELLLISYTWNFFDGFDFIWYNQVHAVNTSVEQEWSISQSYLSNAGSYLYVDDINGNGSSEIYIINKGIHLYDANGSAIWSKSNNDQDSSDALIYDVNNDGIKDLIVTHGTSDAITAIDGINGDAIWTYSSGISAIDLAISSLTDPSPFIYYATSDSENMGVGVISAETGLFYGYYATDEQLHSDCMVATEIVSAPALLFSTYSDAVYAVQLKDFEFTLPSAGDNSYPLIGAPALSSISYTSVYSTISTIVPNTVLFEDFTGDNVTEIFYVENGNEVSLYDPASLTLIDSVTLTITGNITVALPASVGSPGYPNGVYLLSDDLKVYHLTIGSMVYSEIVDLDSDYSAVEIVSYDVYPRNGDDELLLGYRTDSGGYEVMCWTDIGNKEWSGTPISLGPSRPDQINTGHLSTDVGIGGDYVVITSYNKFVAAYSFADGTFKQTIEPDADIGYTELGDYNGLTSYQLVYFRLGSSLHAHDFTLAAGAGDDKWTYDLGSNNELLDIAVGYIPYASDPNYAKVFVSQNGTGIFALDDPVVATGLLWYHTHSSFLTKYLNVVVDPTYGTVLLANDYHRMFMIDGSDGDILSATTGQYKRVDYLGAWFDPVNIESSFVFLAGNTLYAHNIASSGGSVYEMEEKTPVSMEKILRLVIPSSVMVFGIIVTIVLFLKKETLTKVD